MKGGAAKMAADWTQYTTLRPSNPFPETGRSLMSREQPASGAKSRDPGFEHILHNGLTKLVGPGGTVAEVSGV